MSQDREPITPLPLEELIKRPTQPGLDEQWKIYYQTTDGNPIRFLQIRHRVDCIKEDNIIADKIVVFHDPRRNVTLIFPFHDNQTGLDDRPLAHFGVSDLYLANESPHHETPINQIQNWKPVVVSNLTVATD